jgi:replicative DNA helicase
MSGPPHEAGVDTGEQLLRKVPPHSLDAERAVLGALLLDARAMDDVAGVLQPEQFYRSAHSEIYKTIAELWRNDQPVDVVLVNEELNKKGLLDQVGGTPFLVELTEAVPTSANASFYAELVRDYSTRRKLIEVAAEVQKDAYEDTGPTPELLDRSEKRLFDVTQKRIRSEAVPVEVVVKEAFERLETLRKGEGVNGTPSGLADLDELTQGFQPGEMTILAARPSMGKTSLALTILRNITVYHGKAGVFFSLEMPRLQVTSNILCGLAKIDGHKLRGGYLTRDEERQFLDAAEVLGPAQLFIDDTPGLSTMDLRAKARRLKAQHDIDMIMIDYMQLMSGSAHTARESRQQEVSEISRQTKALARELEIPIIALAQLSRKVEERKDHEPMMSDLRESGSIEQDADLIMLLYRPAYYEPENEALKGVAYVNVAKNRNGPTGKVQLHFQKNQMRFESVARM